MEHLNREAARAAIAKAFREFDEDEEEKRRKYPDRPPMHYGPCGEYPTIPISTLLKKKDSHG